MVLLAAVCFGGIAIMVTLATRAGASLEGTLFWRYAIGGALLALVSGVASLRAPGHRAWGVIAGIGVLQAAVAFVSLSALAYIPVAMLTFLFYTFPAWIALFAAIRGTERLTGRRLAALALALAGIGVMVGHPGAVALHPLGIALALGSAFLYALYVPLLRRLQRTIATPVVATYAAIGAAAAFAIAAVIRGGAESMLLPPAGWAAAGALGVVSTALGFLLFLAGLETLGSVRAAILSTVEPFCTALLGAIVLGQAITTGTILGGVLIAGAVVLLQSSS